MLLKGVSTCLWQEFQGGTYSQIWESEATTLFKELNEQKLFIQTKLSAWTDAQVNNGGEHMELLLCFQDDFLFWAEMMMLVCFEVIFQICFSIKWSLAGTCGTVFSAKL